MIGRLIAGLVLGLLVFVLASVLQALLLPAGIAGEYSWLILIVILALALFIALRASTIRNAWGHLIMLNGVLSLILASATLLPGTPAAQEEYRPEVISDAAARYIAHTILLRYGGAAVLFIAVILIASSLLLLLQSGRDKQA